MADSKFKRAIDYAYQQDMADYPSQWELENRYSFSKDFEQRMSVVIKGVNNKYFTVMGHSFSRYSTGLALMLLAALAIGILHYRDVIDYSQARFVFAMSEIILLTIFGVSVKKVGHNMTRTYQTGFSDYEEFETAGDDLEFSVPVPPENYVKTGEYRTTTSHQMEFSDTAGRTISYSRIDIHTGVLTKIDTPDKLNTARVGQWEAIWFIKDGVTNLVWADKRYRYTLKGSCKIEKLIEMAESI